MGPSIRVMSEAGGAGRRQDPLHYCKKKAPSPEGGRAFSEKRYLPSAKAKIVR
jgi:hypothetical protein